MSREPRSFRPLPSALDLAAPAARDGADPELLELPRPPRAGKVLAALALAAGALAAFAMAIALRRDVFYAFAASEPAPVGDLRTAPASVLSAHENGFVRADGLLGAGEGIRYERPLRSATFRALPVVGRAAEGGVWVEVREPAGDRAGLGDLPRTFAGRLVALDAADLRHRGLAKAIEGATRVRVTRGAFLLIDGEDPGRQRFAVALAAVFLALAAANTFALGRLLRRLG